MAITVKNDTSGQAVGAIGISSGIDKNRAYGLNLDQQELQRQQLAQQQKASEQRFQEYKDRLVREDKMNEREAEIKARTMEAAARESEANLAMQKERLELDRANSEAVAGRADANIDIQRQQLNQNSNANQMVLHQQKLSYTQEAENAKIDESLRRIQSDVASGRLSPAAAKQMTLELENKRYGTSTPQEEPTAEQRFNDGLVERNGVTYRQNERTGAWEDVELDQKKLDAEIQYKQEELKQKQAEVNQKLQEKKLDMAMKIVESSINSETGVASKSLETAMKEISGYFGDTGMQAGGAPMTERQKLEYKLKNGGKSQAGITTPTIPVNTPAEDIVPATFYEVVEPMMKLDESGEPITLTPAQDTALKQAYADKVEANGGKRQDAIKFYEQNKANAYPKRPQEKSRTYAELDINNPADRAIIEGSYAAYREEMTRLGIPESGIMTSDEFNNKAYKDPKFLRKYSPENNQTSIEAEQARDKARTNTAIYSPYPTSLVSALR